jgi:hypothetical protein
VSDDQPDEEQGQDHHDEDDRTRITSPPTTSTDEGNAWAPVAICTVVMVVASGAEPTVVMASGVPTAVM